MLEPDSSTGLFEWVLWREKVFPLDGHRAVVGVGDSRLGYAPKLCNALESETGYFFRNAGVAGSDPRTWYYMLRSLDPTARRYRAVIIGLDSYSDQDNFQNPFDDLRALHFVITHLRIGEILTFARTFGSFDAKWEAFRGATFKGFVYQSDLLEFLDNPRARIRKVRFDRDGFEKWNYDFLGSDHDMRGLEIDWEHFQAHLPPTADDNQRSTAQDFLAHPPASQTGRNAAFRRYWFGRIANWYSGTGTKIVFIRLPRGPMLRPESLRANDYAPSVVRELAQRPDILLADPETFDSLEHPEYFADGMHLNKAGVAIFSETLARTVARLIGPPR